jgi:hypothetical protein
VPILLNVLLALAFAGAVTGAVHLWRRQLVAGRREDLQALAARRGWSLTVTGERLGRAGTLRLTPRGGHPWAAEARPGAGRAAGTTSYDAEEPRWAEGTLVVAAAPAEELGRLGADLGPIPWKGGLTVLADADPTRRVDLGDVARVLGRWQPVAQGGRGAPVMILSPAGLRLSLRHPVARADHMERFVDLAHKLSRIIGP